MLICLALAQALLVVAAATTITSTTSSRLAGGIIKDKNITFTKHSNPIIVTKDIIIKKDSKLTIEAGAELIFEKKKGIIVYGVLEVLGKPNDKVRFSLLKSQQSATVTFRSQYSNPLNKQQVRLVDGDLPSEGRVQIKFNDRWHSLCTNSKNLTAADIKILCQEVGYHEGAWYRWFPRRSDTTFHIMTKSFECSGNELAINQCKKWNRIRVGGGICDSHSDIGIRCSRTLIFDLPTMRNYDYWRGVEFVNSETVQEYVLGGQSKQKVSKSKLQHLVITEAGVDEVGNATAAIRVFGQPPILEDIEIKDSIYGIMFENVDDAVSLKNIKLHNNLGYPLFINTSWGKVMLDNLHVENNHGDAIRFVRHEKILAGTHDFCKFANLGSSQVYPIILSHEQTFFTAGQECCQEFISNNQLTVHFPVLRSTPNNLLPDSDSNRLVSIPTGVTIGKDAYLVIYDDYRDEYPFKLRVQNSTRAQSIVSKSGRLKICYEPASFRTVFFTIQVVTDYDDEWTGRSRDLEITNSFINQNSGRGIWIDNQRSGVKILNTTVTNNNYLSGLHVENGTGEVILQGGKFSNNNGHGILINLAGGYYHIDNSTISENSLRGISIEYDRRSELVAFNHTFHLGYSLVASNGESGLFIGNVCRSDAFWNVSMNSFIKNQEDAILFQSCLPTTESLLSFRNTTSRMNSNQASNNLQELFISHNSFHANHRKAISIFPVYFVKLLIRHNLFRDHSLAVLHIAGDQERKKHPRPEELCNLPTNVRIASNRFYANKGRHVANIGVEEDNPKQSLVFTKNFLEDNVISEPYTDLKPRSRVSAVVVVSSSNTKVIRNRFDNPQSTYEIGSHLEAHSKVINATTNFWGSRLDAVAIYKRIFDRKNRYNLAQIEFLQYLLSPEDLEYATDLSFDRERDKISTFRNGTHLGGEVKGLEELATDVYLVEDDIFIRPGAHLIIKPGSTLKFHDGVGLMVQGRLDAVGLPNSPITFTSSMQNKLSYTQSSSYLLPSSRGLRDFDELNHSSEFSYRHDRTRTSKRETKSTPSSNVRLSHTTMGKLEVQLDGVWGSVCDYKFDIDDAAVACQQLGLIVNKDDWLLEKFQYTVNEDQQNPLVTTSALMTNLRCDPAIDTDITKCKAELSTKKDFDGICSAEVGIRCFSPSWSGLRLGMGAETSTLEHIVVQKAGMYDYATYSLRPALQIDFNKHLISSIAVRSNSDSGIGIMMNDVIGRHFSELSILDSKFSSNERHGIELRSRGISFKSCIMNGNRQNGLDYSPTFSKLELEDLLSWLYASKRPEHITMLAPPLKSRQFTISSAEDSYRFFVIQKSSQVNIQDSFTISTDPGHMLSIQLINPIYYDSTEDLNMTLGLNSDSPLWNFRINMTSFPMVSPGYKFHFNYSSGSKPQGNIVLYIRSRYNNRDLKLLNRYIPPHLVMHKFDQTAININSKLINSITISNSTITKNGIGLKFKHTNSFFGWNGAYHPRYSNESTNITANIFDNNYFSSIFVSVDELEPSTEEHNITIPPAEISYNMIGNKIRRNRDGIRQHIRDTRFSTNIFHWSIRDTSLEQNKGGGVSITLPYYSQYDANMSHSIEIYNNSFSKNNLYEFTIDGYYTSLNISSNTFRENRCRKNLIMITGMEKRLNVRGNTIEYNTCGQVVELNMNSHADKLGIVPGSFTYNSLRYNRKPNFNTTSVVYRYPKMLNRLHPHSSDYTLNLGGIQPINLTRNVFLNPELRFELLVSVMMDASEVAINAIENYWGSTLFRDIQDKIFDFDDWNNYATVEISPVLVQDSFTSASMNLDQTGLPVHDVRHLGGRLTRSLTLLYRKEPYIVESDLTVMPNVKLSIEKGVTLEFMPNIGILVLGDLIAAGSHDKPIVMRPFLSDQEMSTIKPRSMYNTKSKPYIMQTNLDDPLSNEHNYAFKHFKLAYPVNLGSIRLCKNEICNDGTHIFENNIEDQDLRQEAFKSSNNTWRMDGFLEIFNATTLQWVPVCDPLFTEHNARVVCRQLGYSHFSLFKRGRRMTIEHEQISSIKNWPPSVRCLGDESSLSNCPLAIHSSANHSTLCTQFGNQHTYIYCEDLPDPSNIIKQHTYGTSNEFANFWGGIRFSCPPVASAAQHSPDLYNYNIQVSNLSKSRLVYVTLDRAGMSHMRRSPTIQVLQCNVQVEYVTITNSAHHGLEVVTSQANQNFHQLRIRNSLGVGFHYVSLTGSSSSSKMIPYLPLKFIDMADGMFGMVNICGIDKEISIEERALIFFKYESQPIDCVKIISSRLKIKHLGIRMLQFNLFNSTSYSYLSDSVKIYDGSIFDRDARLIVDLGVTERHRIEKPEFKFYQTTDSTMTVRLHVSGASSYYGFIAEVVTTPVSYALQRDNYNNLTFSELFSNKLGAISIYNAGESSPNLIIKNNHIENNCMHLFGNFTSCVNPIYMELQNCPLLKMINNLVKNNQGGATIKSYSHTAIAALDATIEKNVFEGNINTNTLALLGPRTDPYQTVKIMRNFFTRNTAPFLSNIVLSRIVANFSYNIISSNIGRHQIEVIGFDKLPLSHQTFTGNWIYNNTATYERDRSTIFGNSAGQQYSLNYLVNRDNHFELSTMNWSRFDTKPYHVPKDDEIIHLASGDGSSKDYIRKTADSIPVKIIDTKQVDLYHATINAKSNWWGFSSARAIQGRIRDRVQHEELIKVDFLPYLETNTSLLSGICAGGWQRVSGACLFFVGIRMTYHEAKDFCDQELSTLPLLRGNHYEFSDFIRSQDREFDARVDRIWIRSFDVSRESCPALNDYRTKNYDCHEKHAFICEKDPLVVVSLLHWHRETGGLVAMILALITASLTFCCTICWAYKSRQRHKEKLDRKSSIYATIQSKRGPYSSANSLIECLTTTRV